MANINEYNIRLPYFKHFKELRAAPDIQSLIKAYFKGYDEGLGDAKRIKAFVENLQSEIDEYLYKHIFILDTVKEYINKNFEKGELKLVATRLNPSFSDRLINMIFIIETDDMDKEFDFSYFLTKIEGGLLDSSGHVARLVHINAKDENVDFSTIEADFPITLPTLKKP